MKERWLRNAKRGKLNELKEIYEELKNKGLQQEVKHFNDSSGRNALIWASWKGYLDICQFMLREDLVDVNSKNDYGHNALHYAANNNRPEIVKLLLEETSIDVNAQTNIGRTALHFAAYHNYPEVTRNLLKYKPRLLKTKSGETPLDVARRIGYKEFISLLETHYNS